VPVKEGVGHRDNLIRVPVKEGVGHRDNLWPEIN